MTAHPSLPTETSCGIHSGCPSDCPRRQGCRGNRQKKPIQGQEITWPWVLKIFLYFFQYITHKSCQENFTSRSVSSLLWIQESTGSTSAWRSWDQIILSFSLISESITGLTSCDLGVILVCYQPFAFQRMQVPALPGISCTVFSSAVQAGDLKKGKNKICQPGESGQPPQEALNFFPVLIRLIK